MTQIATVPLAQVRDRLRFSVEDRFVILRFWEESALLPTGHLAPMLAHIFGSLAPGYSLICDIRVAESVTNDMVEFLNELRPYNPIILAREDNAKFFREELYLGGAKWASDRVLPLRRALPQLRLTEFPLPPEVSILYRSSASKATPSWRKAVAKVDAKSRPSVDEYKVIKAIYSAVTGIEDDEPDSLTTYQDILDSWGVQDQITLFQMEGYDEVVSAVRWLAMTVPRIARNSLLTHFALNVASDHLVITPYHGHATYNIETPTKLILGRPAVLARKTQSLLSGEIAALSALLSARHKEIDIQRFLERNPAILCSLGYTNLYPQIVLTRDDGTYLQPDFILQPAGEEWCDILDIKIPSKKLIVGGRDRKTLAACIHELAAQLREYSSYFENPVYAKRVEDIYGIKCYRPKLIGIVGRNVDATDARQARRLMTAYGDMEFLTFDRLIAVAKTRLLI